MSQNPLNLTSLCTIAWFFSDHCSNMSWFYSLFLQPSGSCRQCMVFCLRLENPDVSCREVFTVDSLVSPAIPHSCYATSPKSDQNWFHFFPKTSTTLLTSPCVFHTGGTLAASLHNSGSCDIQVHHLHG